MYNLINKLKIIILTLAALCCSGAIAQNNILTLQECIRIGIDNNLSLKGQSQDVEKARLEYSESRARLLPVINGFGNFTNNINPGTSITDGSELGAMFGLDMPYMTTQALRYNTSTGAQVSMPLYNQTLYTGISIVAKMEKLRQHSYEKAKEDITVEIGRMYFLAQTTIEQIRLIDENVARLRALAEITEAFYDNGMAMEVDLKRVNINLENLSVQRANAEAMYQQQLNLLRYILDLPMETDISLTQMIVDKINTPELTGISEDLNELKMLYSQKEIIEQQKKAINHGYIPSLSLVGQLAYTNYTDHFDNYFHANTPHSLNHWYNSLYWGLSLRVPIFDGFSKRLSRQKAHADYIKVQFQIEDTEKNMITRYNNATNDWINSYRNFNKQKNNYSLAKDVYNVTAERYKEGIASMTELLQDEMRLTEAQNNFISAHYNCKVTELSILKLTGKLDKLSHGF